MAAIAFNTGSGHLQRNLLLLVLQRELSSVSAEHAVPMDALPNNMESGGTIASYLSALQNMKRDDKS